MKIIERVMVSTDRVTQTLCNKCGQDCSEEQVGACAFWGWASRGLDGQEHYFDLCQDCYEELAKTFKIPPTIV